MSKDIWNREAYEIAWQRKLARAIERKRKLEEKGKRAAQ